MIFGKKIKHKLPKFPEGVADAFHSLCEALPVESLPDIRVELTACMDQLYQTMEENSLMDKELAENIYQRCLFLLNNYEGYDDHQRSLAIGAIRYFVVLDDPIPDDAFSSGLYDDAMVMNHVLEQLGAEDMTMAVS